MVRGPGHEEDLCCGTAKRLVEVTLIKISKRQTTEKDIRKDEHEDCWPAMKAAASEADTKGLGFFGQLMLRSVLVARLEQLPVRFEGRFYT